jgi:hypothetical protein
MKIQRLWVAALSSVMLIACSLVSTTQAQIQAPQVRMNPAEGSTQPSLTAPKKAVGVGQAKPRQTGGAISNTDDNQNSTPTAWWIFTGQSPTDVGNTITNDNARPVDISVDAFSPNYSFTVTYVQNTGAYAKTFWWYYGIDAPTLASLITTNNGRVEVLKAYDIGGGNIRFAVVMISNTGADAKAWWYYYGVSVSQLSSLATTNNARITNVESYVSGGTTYYAAIMISNTGADAASWWWYVDASPTNIANAIAADDAMILDFTPVGDGNFNVAMVSCGAGTNCPEWWYYYGVTGEQALSIAVQNGARINSVGTSSGCGGSCFNVVMLNNSNEITTRVGNLLRADNVGGVEGLYLKQVGGPVLAALEDGTVYEPASSIKVLIHLYALTQVQNGNISLNTQVPHYTNGPDSCPQPPVVSGTEPLQMALREMMWHSDNARTHELTDYFGDTNINAFAKSIGMTNTSINHIIGCGGPIPDTMTQDDAATLYSGVANGSLLDENSVGTFYSLMAGKAEFESEGYDFTGIWSPEVAQLISEEAPSGYTAAQEKTYQANMDLAYKAGGYTICSSSCVDDISLSGWFEIPFCAAGGTSYNQYTFGIFIYDAPDGTVPGDNFNNAKAELMREQLQAGLTSCLGKALDTMSWTPASLTFAKLAVGKTSAAKNIAITNKEKTTVSGISIAAFGDFSETNTCSSSLAPKGKCTISVTFTPSATGERTGAVIVSDNGSPEPQTMELTGTGK